jgi:hypothetical protein
MDTRLADAAPALLPMPGHESRLWTDRSWLRDVQYRTEANLAARQSPDPEQLAGAVLRRLRRDRDGTIRVWARTGCLIAR